MKRESETAKREFEKSERFERFLKNDRKEEEQQQEEEEEEEEEHGAPLDCVAALLRYSNKNRHESVKTVAQRERYT